MGIAIAFILGAIMGIAFMAMAAIQKERRNGESVTYGWAARDEDGELWHYDEEPTKDIETGNWNATTGMAHYIYPEHFRTIRTTDARATRMALTIDTERRGDEE